MSQQQSYTSTALVGMKAICQHMAKSETTMLKIIRCENFPATKISGEWVSDRKLVEEWRQNKIRQAMSSGWQ